MYEQHEMLTIETNEVHGIRHEISCDYYDDSYDAWRLFFDDNGGRGWDWINWKEFYGVVLYLCPECSDHDIDEGWEMANTDESDRRKRELWWCEFWVFIQTIRFEGLVPHFPQGYEPEEPEVVHESMNIHMEIHMMLEMFGTREHSKTAGICADWDGETPGLCEHFHYLLIKLQTDLLNA